MICKVCKDCGWQGDIGELDPQVGDRFGNELCPSCGGMDVISREEAAEPAVAADLADRGLYPFGVPIGPQGG